MQGKSNWNVTIRDIIFLSGLLITIGIIYATTLIKIDNIIEKANDNLTNIRENTKNVSTLIVNQEVMKKDVEYIKQSITRVEKNINKALNNNE